MYALKLLPFLSAAAVNAATAAQWRGRIIYQVLTDRFGRTDGSTSATCDPAAQVYCGGTWQGIIDKLDYIQNMGFTAVHHFSLSMQLVTQNYLLDLDFSCR